MFFNSIKILFSHGRQAIRRPERVELSERFRGRPVLCEGLSADRLDALRDFCPAGAIGTQPFSLDLGRCIFCGECALCEPDHIRFTNDYRISSTTREGLIIEVGQQEPLLDPDAVDPDISRLFGRALKLRQVSAGGDNSCEMELNAAGNVNFDMRRWGVEFVASPRHADGVVVTGPVTRNMARALEITLEAIPEPRIVIAVGSDAISGGLFAESPAIDRSFFERHRVDLYVPGNPAHPMTFITGVLALLGRKL